MALYDPQEQLGASLREQAFVPSGQALVSDGAGQAVPTLTGFDPSRTRPKGWSKRKWKNFKYRAKFCLAPKPALYLVYREGGGMPTVVYTNRAKALGDAEALSKKHRGERFHVLATASILHRPAIATEARRAETGPISATGENGHGSVHEGADPKGIAQ